VSLEPGDKWLLFLSTENAKIDLGGCGPSTPLSYLEWSEKDWKSRIMDSDQTFVKEDRSVYDILPNNL